MSLHQLYQQEIKQHSRQPVGANLKFEQTHQAEGYNPSCGDELDVYLQLASFGTETQIRSIGFHSDACAICTASASLLCEHSRGKTVAQLERDIRDISESLNNKTRLAIRSLECLSAVSKHPSRINCALLPWQTLKQALNSPQLVTN